MSAAITNVRATCDETRRQCRFDRDASTSSRPAATPARRGRWSCPISLSRCRAARQVVAKRIGNVGLNFAAGSQRAQTSGQATVQVSRAAATLPEDVRRELTRERKADDPDAAIDPLSEPEIRDAVARATFEHLIGFQLTAGPASLQRHALDLDSIDWPAARPQRRRHPRPARLAGGAHGRVSGFRPAAEGATAPGISQAPGTARAETVWKVLREGPPKGQSSQVAATEGGSNQDAREALVPRDGLSRSRGVTETSENLAKLPLDGWHRARGGRMVPFAGYEMPVQYEGIMAEHLWAREHAGLFDVSHMGQLLFHGPDVDRALETLLPGDLLALKDGRLRYSMLLAEDGGIIDDLMATRRGEHFYLVVNGATKHGDIEQFERRLPRTIVARPYEGAGAAGAAGAARRSRCWRRWCRASAN